MRPINTDLFCPACGVQDVWQDADDPGDYYAGTSMHCLACDSVLSDISVSAAPSGSPPYAFYKEERDAFIRCVRTGEQPKPRVDHPLTPEAETVLAIYQKAFGRDLYREHPAFGELTKAEPFSGLAFYLPVSCEDEP
jgi:hypothetical protein